MLTNAVLEPFKLFSQHDFKKSLKSSQMTQVMSGYIFYQETKRPSNNFFFCISNQKSSFF